MLYDMIHHVYIYKYHIHDAQHPNFDVTEVYAVPGRLIILKFEVYDVDGLSVCRMYVGFVVESVISFTRVRC